MENITNLGQLSVEQFAELKRKMDNAENDTTPYAVVDDGQISVVGDVEKTETKKHDYVIAFAYPNTEYWKEKLKAEGVPIINETENYIGVKRTYKDIWVPPRVYTAVQTAFAEVYQFFNVTTDSGEIRDLTNEEMIEALHIFSQNMIDSMCHAVATVLHIDPSEEAFMLPISTMRTIPQMIDDFPEIINGMDFFTDKSLEIE